MEKLKIGVIGLGGMGMAHCETCKEIDEVELTAVCDIDGKISKEAADKYSVKGYTDYRKLIDSGEVQAVVLATPHYFHPPAGIYAMKKGLHLLSEKPIAVTVDMADKMISAAKKTKKVFSVMFQNRSLPYYLAAKKLIDEGRVGRIYRTLMICGWFRTRAYYNSAGWRATWKTEGGGVLINQSPHSMDMFCWLAGLPDRVDARVVTRRHEIEVEDEVHALLRYSNGALGYLYASVNEAPVNDRIEILGEKGKIVIENATIKFASLKQPVQEFCDTSPDMWGAPEAQWEEVPLQERETGHKAIIRNFARAVLYGEKLLSPGSEGGSSLELANAILFSGKKNKEVKIPLNRKEFSKFFGTLVARSKVRKVKETKRVTDTKFAK
jgi:predicted dehydrogenase